jgi:hypothetical protein
MDGDEKRAMIDRVAGLMQLRISEANATDYSRLAWLYVNIGQLNKARQLAAKGLEFDPTNSYCLRLMELK